MPAPRSEDAVDLLNRQHERMAVLLASIGETSGEHRRRLFADFVRLLRIHEAAERTVVYPAARDDAGDDPRVAIECLQEGAHVVRLAGELCGLGTEHPAFPAKLAVLRRAALDHAARQERDEFPLLRTWLPVQRLHAMAGHIRNLQAMS